MRIQVIPHHRQGKRDHNIVDHLHRLDRGGWKRIVLVKRNEFATRHERSNEGEKEIDSRLHGGSSVDVQTGLYQDLIIPLLVDKNNINFPPCEE